MFIHTIYVINYYTVIGLRYFGLQEANAQFYLHLLLLCTGVFRADLPFHHHPTHTPLMMHVNRSCNNNSVKNHVFVHEKKITVQVVTITQPTSIWFRCSCNLVEGQHAAVRCRHQVQQEEEKRRRPRNGGQKTHTSLTLAFTIHAHTYIHTPELLSHLTHSYRVD